MITACGHKGMVRWSQRISSYDYNAGNIWNTNKYFTLVSKICLKVKMSAIVSGILNSTVGLLCSKLRDYTAQRLQEGDPSDDICRQIVVRELDDIRSKLDGLSRKDLLASLSFFKEGVTRLYNSLETSGEACDQPRTSKAHIEGATTTFEQFSVTQAERNALESAFDLSEATGNLKIASQERFKLAKESFKESKKLATEAFNNVALATDDRLMASKLRIASRILEGLDDAEAAVQDCLLYLKELQDLPAVQAMFSVWRGSDKGITSRLRARFNKKERNINIESIQMINALLIDLAMKFPNIRMGLFNWPTVKIGRKFYHPLLDEYALQRKIEDKKEQCPWFWQFDKNLDLCLYCLRIGLTNKGEILSITADKRSLISLEMTKKSGQLFCTIPSENDEGKIYCFAVDENDNVYIIVLSIHGYKLLIFDANGNHKEERHLKEFNWLPPKISVPKDGLIVLYCQLSTTMYIYDIHVKEDYKFLVPFQDAKPENTLDEVNITVSNKNDIILSFVTRGSDKLFIYVLTMNGQLKRGVQEPVTLHSKASRHLNVISNDINETIIVSFYTDISGKDDSDSNDDNDDWSISIDLKKPHTTILILCSRTGELLHQHHTLGCYPHMTSHPSGHIVLANNAKAIILRM